MPSSTDEPWIWYLVNIATLAAVLAFPLPLQIVWTVLAPLLFGLVRLIQGGFAPDFWFAVALDVSFALILGGVILTLGWVFRSVAANVDETRARAVASYAQAAAADAAEQERVAVAALMHDSVLAALIAAERAETPRERTLAAGMAREALTRLANTEQDADEGSDEPVDCRRRRRRDRGGGARARRRPRSSSASRRRRRADHPRARRARAHARGDAGGRQRAAARRRRGARGVGSASDGERCSIEVRDTGAGFDLEDVPGRPARHPCVDLRARRRRSAAPPTSTPASAAPRCGWCGARVRA